MTQQKKYTLLRNLALCSICGYLCFSLFPFPPIIWRLLFIVTVFFIIGPNLNCLNRLEKTIIAFWGLNITYFFVSYLWLASPSITQIGNISVTLFALPAFKILGKKGVMTNKFYVLALILLLISSFYYFEAFKVRALEIFYYQKNITNNGSVVFLYILPIILFIRNRYISYGATLICAYFLMEGAKRGNIICAIPVLLLFIILTFRNKQVKIYEKFFFILFFIFAVSWGTKQFAKNEYLQSRVEQTIEGNSSNRDVIYNNIINVYLETESLTNIIFGYGFEGAVNHPNIRSYAHNDWLEIIIDYGLLGVIFYLTIFILLFQCIRKEKDIQKRYVIIAVMSIWFFKSIFSMGFTSETMFILFLSLGYVSQQKENSLKIEFK